MVLPEDLCLRLTALAEHESRTLSNMARVLIQQGVMQHEEKIANAVSTRAKEVLKPAIDFPPSSRLRGAPRRIRLERP